MLSETICQQARLARDARFDGLFFVAVSSTGIFCRPICPARPPAENNVQYFFNAAAASAAGYRPCLRCRPDSAPGSAAWAGSQTTLTRALKLIDEGALQQQSQAQLCERLGISERYLRKLFQQHLGLAPKQYALMQQVLFAKKLLHETALPIADIAFQAGFNSIRRFNDAFKRQLQLNPASIRRRSMQNSPSIELELSYRPPLAWQAMLAFWQARTLDGVDWVNGNRFGRTFSYLQQAGWFDVAPKSNNSMTLRLFWPGKQGLFALLQHIRRLLDLDANMLQVEQQLTAHALFQQRFISGLRIPGLWCQWEAGVRAVLGQQVSVAGARTQLNRLVQALGVDIGEGKKLFPPPEAVATSDLQMIKVPQARRETLKALANYVIATPDAAPETWLSIKGIGPWTINYARMRGLSDSDIWLGGDLGVQKALAQHNATANGSDSLAPWRSYATLQLWFSLGD